MEVLAAPTSVSNVERSQARFKELRSLGFHKVLYPVDYGAGQLLRIWTNDYNKMVVPVVTLQNVIGFAAITGGGLMAYVSTTSPDSKIYKLDLVTGTKSTAMATTPSFTFTTPDYLMFIEPARLYVSDTTLRRVILIEINTKTNTNSVTELSFIGSNVVRPAGMVRTARDNRAVLLDSEFHSFLVFGLKPVPYVAQSRSATFTQTFSESPSLAASATITMSTTRTQTAVDSASASTTPKLTPTPRLTSTDTLTPTLSVSHPTVSPTLDDASGNVPTATVVTPDVGSFSYSYESHSLAEVDLTPISPSITHDVTDEAMSASNPTRGFTTTEPTRTTVTPIATTTPVLSPAISFLRVSGVDEIKGDAFTDDMGLPRPMLTLTLEGDTWQPNAFDVVVQSIKCRVDVSAASTPSPHLLTTSGNTTTPCGFETHRTAIVRSDEFSLEQKGTRLVVPFYGTISFSQDDRDVALFIDNVTIQMATVRRVIPETAPDSITTITIRKTTAINPAAAPVVATGGVLIGIISLAATPAPALSLQAFSLVSTRRCAVAPTRRVARQVRWTLSPMYHWVSPSTKTFNNGTPPSVAVVAWTIVTFLILFVPFQALRLYYNKELVLDTTWPEAFRASRFPNTTFIFLFFSIAGTCPGAFQTFVEAIYPSWRFVSLLGLVLSPITLVLWSIYYFYYTMEHHIEWRPYVQSGQSVSPILPCGAWYPAVITERTHGFIFSAFRFEFRFFFLVDVMFWSGLTIISGLRPMGSFSCDVQNYVMCSWIGLWALVVLVCRPYRVLARTVVRVLHHVFVLLTLLFDMMYMSVFLIPFIGLMLFCFVEIALVLYIRNWEIQHGVLHPRVFYGADDDNDENNCTAGEQLLLDSSGGEYDDGDGDWDEEEYEDDEEADSPDESDGTTLVTRAAREARDRQIKEEQERKRELLGPLLEIEKDVERLVRHREKKEIKRKEHRERRRAKLSGLTVAVAEGRHASGVVVTDDSGEEMSPRDLTLQRSPFGSSRSLKKKKKKKRSASPSPKAKATFRVAMDFL
eukprot:PhM_4_TR17280/c0_g1_i1/m.9530